MSRINFRTILLTSIYVFWLVITNIYVKIYGIITDNNRHLVVSTQLKKYIFIDSDHDPISRENDTCLQLATSKYARYV